MDPETDWFNTLSITSGDVRWVSVIWFATMVNPWERSSKARTVPKAVWIEAGPEATINHGWLLALSAAMVAPLRTEAVSTIKN
jgi:hypothetical protein